MKINIGLSPQILEVAQRLADADDRSRKRFLELLIKNSLIDLELKNIAKGGVKKWGQVKELSYAFLVKGLRCS